ncbi:MAG: TIGR02281 family clan AA aspartic protease [Pseudomonas profundi]|nr:MULTISPECIES: TIGR02281 family clan AA aspartic protease [Pseudomonas]QIB53347.1 TIGR02281 family clan AA aspartic protease [Pseudomonas sp. OIL-1]
MLVLAWIAGLALAANWFAGIEERQRNPNQQPESLHTESVVEVRLDSNRQGHYLVGGQINGVDVTFLLDTGATFVAIPAQVADELGLARGRPVMVNTANGLAESYSTNIESLALGDIRLRDVAAGIVPGMSGDEILLGMSALRQLDFSQQGGQLILRQNR